MSEKFVKLTHVKIFVFSVTCSLGKKFKMMTRSKYKKQFAFLDVNEAPSEETLRDQEANILQLGEKLREEGKTKEMTDLIQKVRHFLRFMSKAKAAKLVRGLVDMFLEMERSDPRGDREVQLCKVNIEFIFRNDSSTNFQHL